MRWKGEAIEALQSEGFVVVIDTAGVSDWQGWGVVLAASATEWGVLHWFYGSCDHCDRYERLAPEECVATLARQIDRFPDYLTAHAAFENAKGW